MENHVVNFSGGRTSAKLVIEIERKIKSGEISWNVEYLFSDTGAEHPKTYEFIKKFVEHTGINLTCIKPVISKELGVGTTYKIVDVSEIGYDLSCWEDMLQAYSSPFNPGGGFCTDMLKSVPSDKYCNDKYGKNNFKKWIGYRADEAKRAWGHAVYSKLISFGLDQDDCRDLMVSCLSSANHRQLISDAICETIDAFGDAISPVIDMAANKVSKIKKHGFRFMFEIDSSEKKDVIDFWKTMPFDLEINEHLGNCVFCIKKGVNKIELAARDEPELAMQWEKIFNSESVRDLKRKFPPNVIYRGHMSFDMVRKSFSGIDTSEITERMIFSRVDGTSSSCNESCEAFSSQIDMFD